MSCRAWYSSALFRKKIRLGWLPPRAIFSPSRIVPDLDRSFVNAVAKKYLDADVYPSTLPAPTVTLEIIPQQVSTPRIPLEEGNPLQPDREG